MLIQVAKPDPSCVRDEISILGHRSIHKNRSQEIGRRECIGMVFGSFLEFVAGGLRRMSFDVLARKLALSDLTSKHKSSVRNFDLR